MSQFAARDQASTLAAPPHPDVEPPDVPERPKPRLTALNFQLLKQKLSRTTDAGHATGAKKPSSPAASGQKHLSLLAEPQIAQAEDLQPIPVVEPPAAPPPEPSPEPMSVPPSAEDKPEEPPPFDLLPLKEDSLSAIDLALSPVERAIAPVNLLAAPHDLAPAGEPFAVAPELSGLEIAREEVFEFPGHRQDTGETGIQDLASLIENASPREMETVEEDWDETAHQARDVRLILEPAVPAGDDFATTDIGEAFAVPRPAAPTLEEALPPAETGPAYDPRPAEYRFWENPGEVHHAADDHSDATTDEPAEAQLAPQSEEEEPVLRAEEQLAPPNEEGPALPAEEQATPESGELALPAEEQAAPESDDLALAEADSEIDPDQASASEPPEPQVRVSEVRRRVLSRPLEEPSEEAGEVARTLIEIMSLPTNATQPQERALAADTLLHLIPRIPVKNLIAMAERLSVMEAPPALILAQLIHDRRIEIAGPLLEKCPAIADHDLIEVMADRNEQSNRMIARRRHLSPIICDALIATDDPSAILTLVRNPGAMLSHEAFHRLNEFARKHPSLQAPLATRTDLPAPVAFELFWVLPAELRRYVLSRFLTDSSTLGKILKLTMRIDSEADSPVAARFSTPEEIDRLIAAMTSGSITETERALADSLGVDLQTASKIVADAHGEPLCVALKALGVTRARFEEIVAAAKAGAMHVAHGLPDLQGFFESLSFNKARVLLTYWDWGVLGTGPYEAVPA